MSNKVYVGQLSSAVSEDTLKAHFADCGDITEVSLPTDRKTGQTKGYAFVSFATEQAAQSALAKNAQPFLDKNITVEIAVEKRKKN